MKKSEMFKSIIKDMICLSFASDGHVTEERFEKILFMIDEYRDELSLEEYRAERSEKNEL